MAVKKLKTGRMQPEAFLEEARVMKSLQHKNIVQLMAVCSEEEPIFIVTEFMKNGSLLDYLRKDEKETLPSVTLVEFATNVFIYSRRGFFH